MTHVATTNPTLNLSNSVGQLKTSLTNRTSSNKNSIVNGSGYSGATGYGVTVRSAAPPPTQKETLHACFICNSDYKDPRVLPCTHTYCFNCIRDKLMQDNRVICPKCNQQVEPFDESELNELPRNLILSQGWRINAQPAPVIPVPKKPVTYQSVTPVAATLPPTPAVAPVTQSLPPSSMSQQSRRQSNSAESIGHESTSSRKKSHGITSLVHAFSRSSDTNGKQNGRTSRSPSVASTQSVSNLVRIYSEATSSQEMPKARSESVASSGKHDELTKIFEQATRRSQQRPSTTSIPKQPSHAREVAYEEMTWDSLVPGTVPVAPPLPDQFQRATENFHQPQEIPKRSSSIAGSDRNSSVENLCGIINSVHQHAREQPIPSVPQEPTRVHQTSSRPSTATHSHSNFDDEDDDNDNNNNKINHVRAPSSTYATIPPRPTSRQGSRASSSLTNTSTSTTKPTVIPPIINPYQQQLSVPSTPQRQQEQQQFDKRSQRGSSIASSTGRSPERFTSQTNDKYYFTIDDDMMKRRSPSNVSIESNTSEVSNRKTPTQQTSLLSTERFQFSTDIPILPPKSNSPRVLSQGNDDFSSPKNRSPSRHIEYDAQYAVPTISSSMNMAVASRVDSLLSDQKRLENEIDEQIQRLKHDCDDVRTQINRKESSLHNEIKTMAANLEHQIIEHYQQQQRVFADLAADTNSIGHELERLKSQTNANINKQQFIDNLEKIETNMKNIRQTVQQQKQEYNVLKFSEGHRSLAADTIGQVTYHQIEPNHSFNSPSIPPVSSSCIIEQSSSSIAPYKYVKIDHLSALEPESIAITENNKKILLGICNKLFILNDYGDVLKTIPLTPSIRGITISKKQQLQNIAYISHDETVSMIDIDNGQTLDCVKETDTNEESGAFLPLGIDTDNVRGDVYVCDYRNSCVIRFDDKLEFISQWRIYNHSDQYDEARPKLISVYGQKLYIIIEHSCKPLHHQGIAYTFSLHICDANSGNIIKIIDADFLGSQRLRWPCSVQAISNEKCYILDTMTSGKYFNGQWQKHWSRVLEITQHTNYTANELFQLDSEAATMAMTKQNMIIAANGDILFVDLNFLFQQPRDQSHIEYEHSYQNLP